MDVPELHRRAVGEFDARVRAITDDQWQAGTPCTEWNVRDLVGHLVSENLWTPWLMRGATIAEAGDRFEGDVLGADPKQAWADASAEAVRAVQEDDAMGRIVHLSFGPTPASEYALQLFADHLIHAWDLARAIGADEALGPDLVDACARWFEAREDLYRAAGLIDRRPQIREGTGTQTVLLGMFGRRA
jgi:uncharacterized protein (TIGR03086 family)